MQGRRYTQRYNRWDDYIAGRQRVDPTVDLGLQGSSLTPDAQAFQAAMAQARAAQTVNPTPGPGQAVQGPGGPQYEAAMKSAREAETKQAADAEKGNAKSQQISQGLVELGKGLLGSADQKKAEEEAKRRAAMAQLMSFAQSGPSAGSIKVGF